MIDSLLSIGCAFDWITPTFSFVQDFLYGPPDDFGIPANAGWGSGDIKRLLNKHGVKVWGRMYNVSGDMLMFTVSKTQSKWTYYLLRQEGIPILYAPTAAICSSKKPKASDPLDSFLNLLEKLEKDLDL